MPKTLNYGITLVADGSILTQFEVGIPSPDWLQWHHMMNTRWLCPFYVEHDFSTIKLIRYE